MSNENENEKTKSEIVKELCKSLGIETIDAKLAPITDLDLTGLPTEVKTSPSKPKNKM